MAKGQHPKSIDAYRAEAVRLSRLTDWLVLPKDGTDGVCYRYRLQAPDGAIVKIDLPYGHYSMWGNGHG